MTHSWIHAIHVLSSLVLTGGLFAGSVVRAGIKRSDELSSQAFGMKLLSRLFYIFTLPGLIITGLLGFHLVASIGFRFAETWIQFSVWIYLAMMVVAMVVVLPVLRQGSSEADRSLVDGAASPAFEKIISGRLWGILHDCITLGVVVLVLLMVLKP